MVPSCCDPGSREDRRELSCEELNGPNEVRLVPALIAMKFSSGESTKIMCCFPLSLPIQQARRSETHQVLPPRATSNG